MVNRCFVGGASSRFFISSTLALFAMSLPAPLASQAPSPPQAGMKKVENQKPAEPVKAAVEAPPASVVFGKVIAESAALCCWPSSVATPPQFEELLTKGQIVRLGRLENGFRCVILPYGPIGYVSKRFTQESEDGAVATKGSKVAFRYRTRTSEAPVAQLPDGTTIHVVGLEDGWFKARAQGVEAWVAAAQVEVVASSPEVIAASDALGDQMKEAVQARLDQIAEVKKQAERDRIDLEAVQVVESAFLTELTKPIEEQRFEPLQVALKKLEEGLAEESSARAACAMLNKRLETQQWIAEATVTRDEAPPVNDSSKKPLPPRDRLQRFESIGWLRYESRFGAPGVFYLEKGGRRQHLLSCNTRRFDLALYVGFEVGVIGPRRTPLADTLSTLDVERIEVLGSEGR